MNIEKSRLWSSLMEMAQFGDTGDGGVGRLALSAADGECRDLFRTQCEAAGLDVTIDQIGNMFARRPGTDPARPPVLIGSHLDSQPTGGKFDGALGVLAGLEVMRTLHDHHATTAAPLELINWTDEEGSRFGRGIIGSAVWAGITPLEEALALADVGGVTMAAALDLIGYRGAAPLGPRTADSYFELHIEQGPVLENEQLRIAAVTGTQAQTWFDVTIVGRSAHAGTTPPAARQDALVCAARVIDLVDRMMRARGEDGRGTVGQLSIVKSSRNTIPGEIRLTVEFRHPIDAEIARLEVQFPREAGFIARDSGCRLEARRVMHIAAQPFDEACIEIVAQSAARRGLPCKRMVSGAGHDALRIAAAGIPTAMIFVPCRGGLSHNPAESITPEEAAEGCQVLLDSVLARAGG